MNPSKSPSTSKGVGKPQRQHKKRKQEDDVKPAPLPLKRKRPGSGEEVAKKSTQGQTNVNPTARDALLEEIKALGGDEDDLALVEDVASDSEHEDNEASHLPIDAGLQQELHALAIQLGFQTSAASDSHGKHAVAEAESRPKEGSRKLKEEGRIGDAGSTPDTAAAKPLPRNPGDKQSPNLPQSSLKKQFKIEPRADWHRVDLAPLPQPSSSESNTYAGATESLKAHAWALLETDADSYSKSVLAASSHKFLSTIMSSGTLSDKVSALTLAIQESPIHNIKAFDTLMSLASKRSRGQAIGALGALVDLLGPGLILPADRRLRSFQNQPELLGSLQTLNIRRWSPAQRLPGNMTEAHLISWAYEDWLKSTYFKIIQLLEVWCNDEIEYSRIRSLDFVYALLKDKPEQETNLLRLIVNKLGDRDRKISSRSSYLLLQLQNSHPGMKLVVVRAIEQEILLRPGQSSRANYYAVATLNQTILSQKDPQTAESLLRVYFDIFVALLKVPVSGQDEADVGTHQSLPNEARGGKSANGKSKLNGAPSSTSPDRDTVEKLISAVLTGINRAAPFVAADDPILENQVDTLFRIAHSSNFNTSIQALILIQQLSVSRHIAFDRFYRTLYESLLDPRLVTSSKQALYLNLLLRSLKADVDTRRVKAFIKRMLQMLGLHQPSFACGILYVVLQLRRQFPDLRTLLEEPEENEPLLETSARVNDGDSREPPTASAASYDGRKRDPEHSNAQHSCLWEITPFLQHFHPSVMVVANGVLSNDPAVQKPELESHSLIRFLDKFVYRNPKATESTRGVSIMQPVVKKGPGLATSLNHPTFWNKKLEQVAADEIFFHHYFQQAGKPSQTQTKGRAEPTVDSEDEDEDEIWKALTSSHPDGPIDDSDNSDLDMGEFDDDDESMGDDDDVEDLAQNLLSDESLDDDDDESGGVEFFSAVSDDEEPAEDNQDKEGEETRGSRRKRLKALPTFASVEDYAALLATEDDM